MQSKLEIVVTVPPRFCDLCGATLGAGAGGICAGCLARRAAETPALVSREQQGSYVLQQMDLQGQVKPERPDKAYILREYAEHCLSCRECSAIGRVRVRR